MPCGDPRGEVQMFHCFYAAMANYFFLAVCALYLNAEILKGVQIAEALDRSFRLLTLKIGPRVLDVPGV